MELESAAGVEYLLKVKVYVFAKAKALKECGIVFVFVFCLKMSKTSRESGIARRRSSMDVKSGILIRNGRTSQTHRQMIRRSKSIN